jgi:putative glutathione S-transferase
VYQTDGVSETCNMDHVTDHYYRSHEDINPTGFVPVGPDQDWTEPHSRDEIEEPEQSSDISILGRDSRRR